jgi:enoyl-CoA hydratase
MECWSTGRYIYSVTPVLQYSITPKIADGMPNRVEPNGTAKKAATELARQIAVFPQICLRGDRLSAIEQFDQPFEKAMANEFKHGLASMAKEAGQGAARFAKGAGRHGEF